MTIVKRENLQRVYTFIATFVHVVYKRVNKWKINDECEYILSENIFPRRARDCATDDCERVLRVHRLEENAYNLT